MGGAGTSYTPSSAIIYAYDGDANDGSGSGAANSNSEINAHAFADYCDMDYDGGGWALVTKLVDADDATLENHRSHKFSGVAWYGDAANSLTTTSAMVASDTDGYAAKIAASASGVLGRVLLPFVF